MSQENDDQMVLLTVELLHSLVREAEALERAIVTELILDGQGKGKSSVFQNEEYQRGRSLYRDLEWRVSRKQLTFPKAVHALGLIIREVIFFHVMIKNFYGSLSKQQPLVPNKKLIKIEPLIEEVVDLFEYTAESKGVEIKTTYFTRDISKELAIFADRDLLHRLFVNLIDNAIKYSYAGTDSGHSRFVQIDCRRHSPQGDVIVTVSSYGVGIDEDEIASGYIFEYGTRGKFAGDRGRTGTGIGLAEVKRIVDAHNGKINIESNKLSGDTYLTSIKVVLPYKSGGSNQ